MAEQGGAEGITFGMKRILSRNLTLGDFASEWRDGVTVLLADGERTYSLSDSGHLMVREPLPHDPREKTTPEPVGKLCAGSRRAAVPAVVRSAIAQLLKNRYRLHGLLPDFGRYTVLGLIKASLLDGSLVWNTRADVQSAGALTDVRAFTPVSDISEALQETILTATTRCLKAKNNYFQVSVWTLAGLFPCGMPIGGNRRYVSCRAYDVGQEHPVFSEFPPAFVVIRKKTEPCFLLCYLDPVCQNGVVAAQNDTGWNELPQHIGEMLLKVALRIDSDGSPLYADMCRTSRQKAWVVTPLGVDLQGEIRALEKVRQRIARLIRSELKEQNLPAGANDAVHTVLMWNPCPEQAMPDFPKVDPA